MHWQIQTYDSLNSTQVYLLKQAESFPEGTCVLAASQTEGTGRQARVWDSSPGGLYFSFLLKPDLLVNDLPWALLWAVLETLELQSSFSFDIKAPNDILYQGKKIAGMLIDSRIQGVKPDYYVCGLGLNLNQLHFNSDLCSTAVSLRQLTSVEYAPLVFCQNLLNCFSEKYRYLLCLQFESKILTSLGKRKICFSYNSPDSVALKEFWDVRAR